MNYRVFNSVGELAEGLADTVVQKVEQGARTVALSGGSTPRSLYNLLGSGERRDRLAQREVIWVTGDERCVPPDDDQSNAKMIRASLFAQGMSPKHQFLRFESELKDPATIARDFEEKWKKLSIDALDVTILGMGEDGHTASLFPGTDVISVTDRIAKEVWVEKMKSWRVTLTFPILQAARSRYVMAAGANKQDMLQRIQNGEEFPVARAMVPGPESWWFVDRPAYPVSV
ncbi:MAG TPA: 6-phosphogluconolactonase [Thermoanaerobaculia bacterium]|nr:6-phosphogluconolactonase [Thermoanaerobaculia bacterium]